MLLEAIINAKKIKYAILKPLVEQNLPSDTKSLNVFISLECIMKQFYRPEVNERMNSLDMPEKYLLSSELINVVAHYRHFFWSRYGVPSTYFVYYSTSRAAYNTKRYPNYRGSFYDKRLDNSTEYGTLNSMIKENLNLANILSEYLPNIYFINTKSLAPSALADFIIKNNQEDGLTNIVLSNNAVDYQMVNNERTFAITLNSDNSKVIRKDNLMKLLLKGSKKKDETTLSSNFYVPSLSISGHKAYELEGVKGVGNLKAIGVLEKALEAGDIADTEYTDITSLAEELFTNDSERIIKNFDVLSYHNLHARMSPKQMDNIRQQIENKSDNQSLMEINNTYYEKYPLQLIELCEGEY